MRTLPTSPRRSASLLRWVVSLLRLPNGWFGSMVNLLYMDLQRTLNRVWSEGIALLYWFRTEKSMSSSSVIGTTWNFISSFILFCKNVNQFLSSEHNKTKHGTARGTSIKLIARENFANFDVIKSQGDLENSNSRVLFFFSLQRITDTLGWSTSCLPTSMWYW